MGKPYDDNGSIRFDLPHCQIHRAYALYLRKDSQAIDLLESAENAINPLHFRRICINRILQAQVYLSQKKYQEAAYIQESLLLLAKAVNENLTFAHVAYLQQELKNSPIGGTRDIIKLGMKVQAAIGDRRVVPVPY